MKARIRPVMMTKRGDRMEVEPRFLRLFHAQFGEGESYPMMPLEERSMASHRGYFGEVARAFENLAEEYDGKFPDSEYLRKWALVECGFCTEATYPMDSKRDAMTMAAALRKADAYAVITVRENIVRVYTAESQSVPSMPKERFDASKKAVLDLISGMARTTPAELKKNAGQSA
jgi:hypothetical protein